MSSKQQFLSTDLVQLINTFANPLDVIKNYCLVNKAFNDAVNTEFFFRHALARMNMYQGSLEPKIEFVSKTQQEAQLFVFKTIQGVSAKQVFHMVGKHIRAKQSAVKEVTVQKQKEDEEAAKNVMNRFARAGCQPPLRGITKNAAHPVASDFGIIAKGFKVHPDSKPNELTIKFSVPEFETQMSYMRSLFGERTDISKITTAAEFQGMITMYHKFMILSVKYPELFLVPMHYACKVWYSHLTHPVMYHQYCKELIATHGKKEDEHIFKQRHYLVPCNFYLNDMELVLSNLAWKQTLELWQKEFNEPMIASHFIAPTFDLTNSKVYNIGGRERKIYVNEHRQLDISYAFVAKKESRWLQEYEEHNQSIRDYFINKGKTESAPQVKLTGDMIVNDTAFFLKLSQSMGHHSTIYPKEYKMITKAYERYLYFVSKYPGTAPSYFIDLAWHTHMCNPIAYLHDTCTLFGELLDHDPTYMPKEEEAQQAEKLWNMEFGTSLQTDHSFAMV